MGLESAPSSRAAAQHRDEAYEGQCLIRPSRTAQARCWSLPAGSKLPRFKGELYAGAAVVAREVVELKRVCAATWASVLRCFRSAMNVCESAPRVMSLIRESGKDGSYGSFSFAEIARVPSIESFLSQGRRGPNPGSQRPRVGCDRHVSLFLSPDWMPHGLELHKVADLVRTLIEV